MGKIKKTTKDDFECPAGVELNKLARKARHDNSNIMKIRILDPRPYGGEATIIGSWAYNQEHKRRHAEEGNIPMSESDCHVICCNMYSAEAILHKHKHCQYPDYCRCWEQICDDVYGTHGHGRPNKKEHEALVAIAQKLLRED